MWLNEAISIWWIMNKADEIEKKKEKNIPTITEDDDF